MDFALTPSLWLGVAAFAFFVTTARGAPNSWISADGKWETGAHWSLGVPPTNTQSGAFITNGFGLLVFSKTVTADFTTASSPGTMTISNLTLSAVVNRQNSLLLTNTGVVPLKVTASLSIGSGGALHVVNAPLQVPGQFVFPLFLGSFFDDGSLTLNGSGALGVITVGSIPFIVGHNSTGGYLQNSGTLSAVSLIVGDNSGAQGAVTLAGGLTVLSSDLTLGSAAGSVGNVALSGGNLIATNGDVVIGNAGAGEIDLSAGSGTLGTNVTVGNLAGSAGTLSVSGGQLIISTLVLGSSAGATGTVSVTGGSVGITGLGSAVAVGLSGVGVMNISNGALSDASGPFLVAANTGSQGTLTVMGGTNYISNLGVGGANGATGTVWIVGGSLKASFFIGNGGSGQLTVSNGTMVGGLDTIGAASQGTLTIAGGTVEDYDLQIGSNTGGTGHVRMTGGQLITVDSISLFAGEMTVSNATVSGFFHLETHEGGTLTLENGTITAATGIVPYVTTNDLLGTMWMKGGQFVETNHILNVECTSGLKPTLILSNGTMQVLAIRVAVPGSTGGGWVAAGGTAVLSSNLTVAAQAGVTGLVWAVGSSIIVTNADIEIGQTGIGYLTESNGTLQARRITLGSSSGGSGVLSLAGGVCTVLSNLNVGMVAGAMGTAWLTGGQLDTTNVVTSIGVGGIGQMIVSNGIWLAKDVILGNGIGTSQGTLTVAGGSLTLSSSLSLGGVAGSTGTCWVTGGQIITTNATTVVGNSGLGRMTLSNGIFLVRDVIVGQNPGAQGSFTVPSGNWTVQSSLVIGDCATTASGIVTVGGGNLFVTNSTGTAVLDVRHGQLILNGGLLKVDKLVMTNSCGLIINNGGLLITATNILTSALDADGDGIPNGYEQAHGLDPLNGADANVDNDGDGFNNLQEYLAGTDPHNSGSTLRIISVIPQGNNVQLTWTTAGGKTNAVQATNGAGGSYATNFTDLATFIIGGSGDVTNQFLDFGGATNQPSRFYRIRLVP